MQKLNIKEPVYILRMGKNQLITNEHDFYDLSCDDELLMFSTKFPENEMDFVLLETLTADQLSQLRRNETHRRLWDDIDKVLDLKEDENDFEYLASVLRNIRLKTGRKMENSSTETKKYLASKE